MKVNNCNSYKVPRFLVSGFDNGKKTLKSRFQSIFEDDKKKRGLIVVIAIVIVATLLCSVFVIGNPNINQTNNSLTIYIRGYEENIYGGYNYTPHKNKFFVTEIKEKYHSLYPDIELNFIDTSELNDEQYYQKLSTEILAGKGPDVILGDEKLMQYRDVEKMIRSATFAELDEFIENDSDNTFADGNHFKPLMDYGKYKGRTYIIPILFDIPILYAADSTLNELGINIDNCTQDYLGFADELSNYIERTQQNSGEIRDLFMYPNSIYPYLNIMGQTPTYNNPTINEELFKQFAESYKTIYPFDVGAKVTTTIPYAVDFKNGSKVFCSYKEQTEEIVYMDNNLATITSAPTQIISPTGNPVEVLFNQPNGNIAANITFFSAINSNSANKQNAYNFIKLLSGDNNGIYTNHSSLTTNINSLEKIISKIKYTEYNDSINNLKYSAFTENDAKHIIDLINKVDTVYCKSPITYEIQELMLPYYKNEATFEECFKQVQDKVSIYATE